MPALFFLCGPVVLPQKLVIFYHWQRFAARSYPKSHTFSRKMPGSASCLARLPLPRMKHFSTFFRITLPHAELAFA